jgi:hypothetical protein
MAVWAAVEKKKPRRLALRGFCFLQILANAKDATMLLAKGTYCIPGKGGQAEWIA